jgi:nucleoporin NDC1
LNTIQILFWYLFSAWWFSEVYMWSSSTSANLGWILRGDTTTPDRLNERPIYLRSLFLMLALAQTASHLYNDYSSVHLSISALSKTPSSDDRTHKLAPISTRIQYGVRKISLRCVVSPTSVALLGPFIYALFLRQIFWSWHLTFAKLIYSLSRSDARPTGYPPIQPLFILRSFGAAFLLVLTWETTSFFFSTFFVQEPVKKDQPLSAGSKDPNGTLINGLKAKRDVVKTFAFWELVIIAQKHPERRKAIFADIGREGGPAWGQMLDAAIDVVQAVHSRIDAATHKPTLPKASANTDAMEIDSLPKIAPPVKQQPIYASSPPPRTRTEEIESYIDWGARRIGSSKHPFSPDVSKGKELLKYVTPAGISPEDVNTGSVLKSLRSGILRSPIGLFFRSTFERKVKTTILGSPNGNAAIMADAIESTTRMLVASLSEDIYGKVISGVPTTVRTFTRTINSIETFVQNITQEPTSDSDIEEVETILARLKASLTELLSAFQLYLTDQGLSAAEHRQAQNASTPGRLLPEREERRKQRARQIEEMIRQKKQQQQQQQQQKELPEHQQRRSGDPRREGGVEKNKGAADMNGNVNERQRGKAKAKGEGNGNGERRPQKRLEPQDPARKKLFQDAVPRNGGRREMEMVR